MFEYLLTPDCQGVRRSKQVQEVEFYFHLSFATQTNDARYFLYPSIHPCLHHKAETCVDILDISPARQWTDLLHDTTAYDDVRFQRIYTPPPPACVHVASRNLLTRDTLKVALRDTQIGIKALRVVLIS